MSLSSIHPDNTDLAIVAGVLLLLLVFAASWLTRRHPHKLNTADFQKKWLQAQALCSSENTWPLAVINGDKLVDDALKKRKYKGKTMGERLVSAQHELTVNDGVWFGHKLRNKLVHEDMTKLKKKEVMEALVGFRQALKDLGALK